MKKTEQEISELNEEIRQLELKMVGKWKHYKGNVYRFAFLSLDANDCEPLVLYRDMEKGIYWTRRLSEWTEFVEHEGQRVQRFVRLEKK